MKRRSIIGLLTVMISILAFGVTGFCQQACDPAAPNCGNISNVTNGCYICGKCPLAPVPCPEEIVVGQGRTTTALGPFDFDGMIYREPDTGEIHGSYGYCDNYNAGNYPSIPQLQDNTERGCNFIFDVCKCPEACEVAEGTLMGIQMIIETPGVYFAGGMPLIGPGYDEDGNELAVTDPRANKKSGSSTVYFDIINRENRTVCQEVKELGNLKMTEVYLDGVYNRISRRDISGILRQEVRNFGEVRYFQTYKDELNAKGEFKTTSLNPGTPLAGEITGAIPAQNRVQVLESFSQLYLFTNTDIEAYECNLWIDIPPMRIDPTIAQKGSIIKLKVRLKFADEQTICEDCFAYCECEVEVGIVCCDEEDRSCIYFPYIFSGIQPWQTGVAVTNLSSQANPTLTFTWTTGTGNGTAYIATHTLSNITEAWMLDDMLTDSNFTWTNGTKPPSGLGWLKISSNAGAIDGYSFVTDTTFGAGTLPRQECP